MATKKDLVEAHAFSRRRLVTAFLSGAPGGREVEPSRPGRTIVGGLALSVLLIAGAAIAAVLVGRTEEDWNDRGLIISSDKGTPYIILEKADPPLLRPLANVTSAQLILGADADPTFVDQETINQQVPGDYIGIFGAPSELPTTDSFVSSGWTACTGPGLGVAARVADRPQVDRLPERAGFLVENAGDYYVIATVQEGLGPRRAYRYPVVDAENQDLMLGELGLPPRSDAVPVPESWLSLFPLGGTLGFESFDLTGIGEPAPGGGTVGQYLEGPGGTSLVLTADGPARLSEFALTVYKYATLPGGGQPQPMPAGATPPAQTQTGGVHDEALWPEFTLQEVRGQHCAVLDPQPDDVPLVGLATDPTGAASAEDLTDPDDFDVTVQAGRGAFVRAGDWDETTSSQFFVVDSRADVFALIGGETLANLDYDADEAPVVPDAWLDLFTPGVALSTEAALCPPDPDPEPTPDQDCQ
ncbi:type VII secretion protein EccB [Nocardioides sp. SYSU D00038]|uniref:type VII secretion protein EccB n=1 Tax=Nocardioides sp. SYSU D00038 TaxID=2812554 RepID=UPI001967D246|nr:type VII secretion protein EccB [Nocardioides sp. SYSU D00038]